MPLFSITCPDYPNNVEKRLAVRPEHLAMGAESRKQGTQVFGRAFLHPDDQSMAGSVMLYRFATMAQAWERIRADPYYIQGVWDREKCEVRELMVVEGDDSLKVAVA